MFLENEKRTTVDGSFGGSCGCRLNDPWPDSGSAWPNDYKTDVYQNVYFLDNGCKMMLVDQDTTAEQVCEELAKQIGFNMEDSEQIGKYFCLIRATCRHRGI